MKKESNKKPFFINSYNGCRMLHYTVSVLLSVPKAHSMTGENKPMNSQANKLANAVAR